MPIFFVRDAIKFPDFIHFQKRNPQTHMKDPNAFWDFLSLVPESLHQVKLTFPGFFIRLLFKISTKPRKP